MQRFRYLCQEAAHACQSLASFKHVVTIIEAERRVMQTQPGAQSVSLVQLRQVLETRFNRQELRTLCFDLDVDYDSLPGEGKGAKARELVAYLERRDLLPALIALVRQQRPDVVWAVDQGARLHELLKSTSPDFAFVDRENELYLLKLERLAAWQSPYMLLNAPAGYGKSFLLRRLLYLLESDQKLGQQWRFLYFDFQLVAQPVRHVIQSVLGPEASGAPDHAVDRICDHVVRVLAAPVSGRRCAVLLVFDAVEHLDAEACRWLYALLNELRRRTCPGAQEIIVVRVIVAGRDVESFWRDYQATGPALPAPRRISLGPFDRRSIQQLIWQYVEAVCVNLDEEIVVQIADEVQYWSAGHPGVACRLVGELAEQSFAVGLPAEYFARHRARLAQEVLAPVARALLDGILAPLREAAHVLSAFRRVNANTVQALLQAGVLSPEIDEVVLLGQMQRAHLLEGPGIREPFYRDRLLRPIWALDMAHGPQAYQTQYRRLNAIALDLYAGWIHNLGQGLPDTPLKATQRMLSVVEWLFHALQDDALDNAEMRLRLERHIGALSGDGASSPVAHLIMEEVRQDAEVCYLLRRRLGKDGFSTVSRWLQLE